MDIIFSPVKELKTIELETIYEGKLTDHILTMVSNVSDPQKLFETGFAWTEINDPVIHTDIQ
jgi:hypothetical protein